MTNYMKLKKFSLFFYHYIFLDTDRYMSDQLFIKHGINVKFGSEFVKEDTPYRFICCKIKKKVEQRFLEALNEMSTKAVLLGYNDYDKYCNVFSEIRELMMKKEKNNN